MYKTSSKKRDPNTILFVGRLEKRKGVLYTLKAFKQMQRKRPELVLKIAGKGPLEKSLKKYISENDIKNVEFLGFISHEDKIELLQTCGIYTSAALYGESHGIVLTEAMACGIPLVAHKNDGYAWQMQETGRISIVDCKDVDEYATRMLLLLEDEDIRAVWQKWAKKYVQKFHYDKIVDSYEKLYAANKKD